MLKGIESQTMVTRTTDFVREADQHQRKNDLTRDHMAVQAQNQIEQEQQQVTQTLKAQEAVIHRDKERRRRQPDDEELVWELIEEDAPPEENGAPQPARGNYIIDIKI